MHLDIPEALMLSLVLTVIAAVAIAILALDLAAWLHRRRRK